MDGKVLNKERRDDAMRDETKKIKCKLKIKPNQEHTGTRNTIR